MSPCRKKVGIIFGGLIFLALLLVPYRETKVDVSRITSTVLARRVTTVTNGHMFLPRFLKTRGRWEAPATGQQRTTVLNTKLFVGEIAVLLFLAVFDDLVFCVWVRRRRRTVE